MGRIGMRFLLGVTVLFAGAKVAPAGGRAAESLGRLALLVDQAVSGKSERNAAMRAAAEIATNLDAIDVETGDWTVADVERVRKRAWGLAVMKKEPLDLRLDALETALALGRLSGVDAGGWG